MPLFILPIIIITIVATLVRSTFGFGESLVAVPLYLFFIPIEIAVPLSVLISVLVALVVVVQDRKAVHIASAKWLVLYAALGIPLGLFILSYGNQYLVKIALSLLIIGYSIYALRAKSVRHLEQDSGRWLFVCGFLSGILGGAYGLNGPPLVVYGIMRRWSAQHFRATLQAYFLPVSFIGILGYSMQGLLSWLVIKYFLFCLPAVIPCIFLGRYFNQKLHEGTFFKYVYVGLILTGGLLLFFTVKGMRY